MGLFLALCKFIGPAEIHCDNRGVVQALNKGEVECINANLKDADLWIQVWDMVYGHKGARSQARGGVGSIPRRWRR